jgi:hypothetical protein
VQERNDLKHNGPSAAFKTTKTWQPTAISLWGHQGSQEGAHDTARFDGLPFFNELNHIPSVFVGGLEGIFYEWQVIDTNMAFLTPENGNDIS